MQPDPDTVAAAPSPTAPTGPPGPPPPEGAPEQVGRFLVRRLLGEGGFGAVYLAYDPDLDREVALKIPGKLTPESRAEFLSEARAAAKITHPNVCQVYDVSATDALPYIVSRFVGGGTLIEYIRKANGRLPVADALRIAGQLADGLAAAHARGIVHRDLKPGNVLFDDATDSFLITDFGLAKVLEKESLTTGRVRGTPKYMSPEQFGDGNKAGEVGPRSDVYTLGVILYELLTGDVPFTAPHFYGLMLAHIHTKPDPPSARRAGLDMRHDALVLKALAKNANDRYDTVKAFGDAIRAALQLAPPLPSPAPSPVAPPPPAPAKGGWFTRLKEVASSAASSVTTALLSKGPPEFVPGAARKPGEQYGLSVPDGAKLAFAHCPGGAFFMGSPSDEVWRNRNELRHRVTHTSAFGIGVGPVTRAEFAHFGAHQVPHAGGSGER